MSHHKAKLEGHEHESLGILDIMHVPVLSTICRGLNTVQSKEWPETEHKYGEHAMHPFKADKERLQIIWLE